MAGASDEIMKSDIVGEGLCGFNSHENLSSIYNSIRIHRSVGMVHQVSKKHFIADLKTIVIVDIQFSDQLLLLQGGGVEFLFKSNLMQYLLIMIDWNCLP